MNTNKETETKFDENNDTVSLVSSTNVGEVVLGEEEYLELKQKEVELKYERHKEANLQCKSDKLHYLAESRKEMFLWIVYLSASASALFFELAHFITALVYGIDSLDFYDYIALGAVVIHLGVIILSIVYLVKIHKYNKSLLLEVSRYTSLAQSVYEKMEADPEYIEITKRLNKLKDE